MSVCILIYLVLSVAKRRQGVVRVLFDPMAVQGLGQRGLPLGNQGHMPKSCRWPLSWSVNGPSCGGGCGSDGVDACHSQGDIYRLQCNLALGKYSTQRLQPADTVSFKVSDQSGTKRRIRKMEKMYWMKTSQSSVQRFGTLPCWLRASICHRDVTKAQTPISQ